MCCRCEDDSEAERRITKTYRALASGIIPTDEVFLPETYALTPYYLLQIVCWSLLKNISEA
jgi:hypothetical protein